MIDTHAHIYLDFFKSDLATVLERAHMAGITDILMPAIGPESNRDMEKLQHPKIRFHKMAGLHPCEIKSNRCTIEISLLNRASSSDIIAIGETGLDYYWSQDHKEAQKQSLRQHCKAAKTLGKPVVLHNRNSTGDLLNIIEEQQDGRLAGVWHCFSGSIEEAQRALDLGLYLGIGGVVTFKNAGVDAIVAQLPENCLLLETDAPYLAPAPHRGKRNEPAFMRFTAEKVAEIKGMTVESLIRITSENARSLFNLSA